jgi:Fuc2NAc and GlcNAc transferase
VCIISLVSFFDDKLGLRPKTRLACQFATAIAVVWPIFFVSSGHLVIQAVVFLFFLVFIVGTANFYNFMDGINGLAGLTGSVGFLLLFFVAARNGQTALALLLVSLSSACTGFLPFNFPSARVFMGDVGSILLGFFFAVAVVLLSHSVVEFLALAGCLFTFYADALSTLFIRWKDGEPLSQAHRRHLYQLLANQKHIPHWKISLGYALTQAVVGAVCLVLSRIGALQLYLFLGVLFIGWCLATKKIRMVECTDFI